MKTFQYQLIRYCPDHFTGEFVNLGVVIFSPEHRFIDCKVTSKYHRLNSLFPNVNGRVILKVLRNFNYHLKLVAKGFDELFQPPANLDFITSNILPKDNSAIQLTEVKLAIDIDLEAALNDLFYDLVEKYILDHDIKETISDDEIWKNKYKKYFDQYQITNRLTQHSISTKNDIFVFDKAWKNEIWHFYEPVSFALKSKDSIKDKVYKWAGRLQGIQQSQEKIHLSLLTSIHPRHIVLNDFINNYLFVKSDNLVVEIISDNDAEKIAQEISKQMIFHDNP